MTDDVPPDYSIVCLESVEAATAVDGDDIVSGQWDPWTRLQLQIARRADALPRRPHVPPGPSADLAAWRRAEAETLQPLDTGGF